MVLAILSAVVLAVAQAPSAISQDPPRDATYPAGLTALAIPTGGTSVNAVLYTASGPGPHRTVLLLHGFPGNEQNLDLAQAVRRAGWDVLTLHYRGSWGSPGNFSFQNVYEDAESALLWIRGAEGRAAGADGTRVVVVGHSVGGMAAAYVAANDPRILGAVLISAASLGGFPGDKEQAIKALGNEYGAGSMHTLAGTSPKMLYEEIAAKPQLFNLTTYAARDAHAPVLVVTSEDGLQTVDDAYSSAVAAAGGAVKTVHFDTDHSYSDARIRLEETVLSWLNSLTPAR